MVTDPATADPDEALDKKGVDLFRELLRVYPRAEVEDYFKVGQWKDEVMKVDLAMIKLHRTEAGAPEPCALEDVKMPELPKATPSFVMVRPPGMGMGMVRPVAAAGVRPLAAVPTVGAATAAAGGAPGGAVAELRLVALFVNKHKLDPNKAKTMLAKLTPARRRYVLQNFKKPFGTEADAALEKYLADCEQTNCWDNVTGPLAALAAAQATKVGAAGAAAAAAKAAVAPKASAMAALVAANVAKASAAVAAKNATAGTVRPAITPGIMTGGKPTAASAVATAAAGQKRPFSAVSGPVAAQSPAKVGAYMPRPVVAVRPALPKANFGAAAVRPATAAPKPSMAVAPVQPKWAGTVRPPAVAPKAKPGSLIANLLTRF